MEDEKVTELYWLAVGKLNDIIESEAKTKEEILEDLENDLL